MVTVFKFLLYGIHVIVSVVLIALVVSQTNKSEGLGVVGGGASGGGTPRGRAGLDEKLDEYTKYTAIVFMALSTILYLMATKYHWS